MPLADACSAHQRRNLFGGVETLLIILAPYHNLCPRMKAACTYLNKSSPAEK